MLLRIKKEIGILAHERFVAESSDESAKLTAEDVQVIARRGDEYFWGRHRVVFIPQVGRFSKANRSVCLSLVLLSLARSSEGEGILLRPG